MMPQLEVFTAGLEAAMETANWNLLGWILTVAALLVLAARGDFGLLTVLVPVSFLLACLMISPGQLMEKREKR